MSTTSAPHHRLPTSPSDGRSRRTSQPLLVAAATTTVILWASAFIGIRATGEYFQPGSLALLRMLVGSAALGIVVAVTGFKAPPRKHLPLLVVWGVAWFGIYNVALNAAELSIDAGTASMIVNIAPLIIVLLGGLFLGERFPRTLVIGAPLSFIGVVLIGAQSMAQGHVQALGVALAFVAAILYAGAALLQKRLLAHVDATTMTWLGAIAGTVALLPWTGQMISDLQSAPAGATWGVVYLGVFPTAVAFTTWAFVLKHTTAGKTAATTYVIPAIALLMSWALLGEVPTVLMLVGGLLCILGVVITRIHPRRAKKPGSK